MGLWFDSFLVDLVAVVISLLAGMVLYSVYIYGHWKRNNIAQMKPVFLFGTNKNLILKRSPISDHFKEMYDYFKAMKQPVGGYYFSLRPELMILDLDTIKQIMVKDFQHFTNRGTFSDEDNDPLTGHLFAMSGTPWKNLRMKLTPTFTSGKMKMMFSTLTGCSVELGNILEEKSRLSEPLDIKDLLARFTTDVIGSCAFGIDCNCLKNPNTDFRKYGALVFEPERWIDLYKPVLAFVFPNFTKFFKIRFLNKNVSDFFINVVNETIRYREENNVNRKDFMQLLLQLKNMGKISADDMDTGITTNGSVDEKGLTNLQVAAQCFIFFVAGFETSSTTMTFCLYELVKNPEIQEKLREEINAVLNNHNGEVSYNAIMEMKYMDQVINETLRKYPPLGFLVRQCTKDYKIPNTNYVMRKGEYIRLSVLGIQRDPDYYPNPKKFDPERFTDAEKAKRHPFAFIPFGEGPRICIGMRFGLMQTKVGLTTLLKDYKFTLNCKTQEPLVMDPNNIILSTKGGVWLDAHKVVS